MGSIKNYMKLTALTTNYASRMKRLSNQIFGDPKRPTTYRSMRVVKLFSALPKDQDEYIYNYYPRHMETGRLMMKLREYGLYRDEHQDFKEEMVRLRALRGKVKKTRGTKKTKEE